MMLHHVGKYSIAFDFGMHKAIYTQRTSYEPVKMHTPLTYAFFEFGLFF